MKSVASVITFTTVLDQYNKHLSFARDIIQKIIAALIAFTVFHFGTYDVVRHMAAHTVEWVVVFFLHGFVMAFVLRLQFANLSRCSLVYVELQRRVPSGITFGRLGILRAEPFRLIFLPWTAVYFAIHLGILIVGYLIPLVGCLHGIETIALLCWILLIAFALAAHVYHLCHSVSRLVSEMDRDAYGHIAFGFNLATRWGQKIAALSAAASRASRSWRVTRRG